MSVPKENLEPKSNIEPQEAVVELKPATETSPELKVVMYDDEKASKIEVAPSQIIDAQAAPERKIFFSNNIWTGIGIVSAIVLGGIIASFAMSPRAITIQGHKPQSGVSSSVPVAVVASSVSTSAPAVISNIPTPTIGDISSLAHVLPEQQVTFSADQYDQKLSTIANVPPPSIVWVGTSTNRVSKSVPSPLAEFWPVMSAPHPNQGALFPLNRVVAYYGNFYSRQMGVLGQYDEPQMLAMLASTTAAWQAADPLTHVIPGIDYIAVTAQGSAGKDGKYRLRMPPDQIEKAIAIANKINGVVILDVQVGLSNAQTEVPLLEPYLKLPQVNLALDPEFSMKDGVPPGREIGTMNSNDINFAANYLANLVKQNNLPPKFLIVHRFTEAMVTGYRNITPLPEVQIVMDMDGFGSPARKLHTYRDVIQTEPVQLTGFKLFYHNDADPSIGGHLMTPSEVLKLTPNPSFIQYQ